MDVSSDDKGPASDFRNILPDWTRTPLPQGAPSANVHAIAPTLGGS